MKTLFEAIQWFFVDFMFVPMDALRAFELKTWFGANLINWIFMIICAVSVVYWIKQINLTQEEDEQDTTAHSFLR